MIKLYDSWLMNMYVWAEATGLFDELEEQPIEYIDEDWE